MSAEAVSSRELTASRRHPAVPLGAGLPARRARRLTPVGNAAGHPQAHADDLHARLASPTRPARARRPVTVRRHGGSHALPDRHLRALLPDRAAALVAADAAAAALAAVHARRELRLLRLVGLALRLPARRVDRREPLRGASRSTARRRPRRASAARRSRSPSTWALLGYFKYADFFVSSAENALDAPRLAVAPSVVVGRRCRSASPSSRSWRSRT